MQSKHRKSLRRNKQKQSPLSPTSVQGLSRAIKQQYDSEIQPRQKVDIFLKLVGILCDQLPQGAPNRDSLLEYPAEWLLAHLEDIDALRDMTPQQGAQVVEAPMRILYNDNEVSRVFEEIQSRKNELQDVEFSIYGISNVSTKNKVSGT